MVKNVKRGELPILKKHKKILLIYTFLLTFFIILCIILFNFSKKLSITTLFFSFVCVFITNIFITLYSAYTFIQVKFFHTTQGAKLNKKKNNLI